jgi:hypothetical protein
MKQSIQRSMVIETVESIKRNYKKKEIEQADKARQLYAIVGRPSREGFEMIIKKRKLLNNPVMITWK